MLETNIATVSFHVNDFWSLSPVDGVPVDICIGIGIHIPILIDSQSRAAQHRRIAINALKLQRRRHHARLPHLSYG